jgi:hypothetical protein
MGLSLSRVWVRVVDLRQENIGSSSTNPINTAITPLFLAALLKKMILPSGQLTVSGLY